MVIKPEAYLIYCTIFRKMHTDLRPLHHLTSRYPVKFADHTYLFLIAHHKQSLCINKYTFMTKWRMGARRCYWSIRFKAMCIYNLQYEYLINKVFQNTACNFALLLVGTTLNSTSCGLLFAEFADVVKFITLCFEKLSTRSNLRRSVTSGVR